MTKTDIISISVAWVLCSVSFLLGNLTGYDQGFKTGWDKSTEWVRRNFYLTVKTDADRS